MRKELITLTVQEHERLLTIRRIMKREIRQKDGADLLGITDRQVRNLIRKVKEKGARGIGHGNRGKPSLKKMPEELVDLIAKMVKEKYRDFKPKFAAEKLLSNEMIKISDEKLRQIMIEKGLWRVHCRPRKVHQWRERKEYYGEMVQMDGSHHDWLEGRGEKLVLMGFVDDARNRFFGRFYDYEGVYPAMNGLECYIRWNGIPQSLYVDKHSTYKTTRMPSTDELLRGEQAQTQFERAARELGIKVIHAHSPQAKGRIERVFGTLQDRLVKEMRLASLSSRDEANSFLDSYLPRFNAQFERDALRPGNLHRPLPKNIKFKEIFCLKDQRTIHNGYFIRWKGKRYAIEEPSQRMKRRPALVLEHFDGQLIIRFEGKNLKYREINERENQQVSPTKLAAIKKPNKGKYIPPLDHPWRRHNPSLHHNCYLEKI